MSYEDILEAQAKLDAKKASVVKGKPGRKRKGSAVVQAQAKRTYRAGNQGGSAEGLLFCSTI